MNIAIIENDTVVNVIVCDSFELAKELTGATEVIDSDENKAYVNFIRSNGIWHPKSPYPSWTLNLEKKEWEPPVAKPIDDKIYVWDESTLSWKEDI